MFHKTFSMPSKQSYQYFCDRLNGGGDLKEIWVECFPLPIKLKGGESDSRFKNLKKGR